MTDERISELPAATTITGAELIELVQDGDNVQHALDGLVTAPLVAYVNSGYPSMTSVQDALDQLLFFAMTASLSGFGDVEIGSTVAGGTLTWAFNKPISGQVLAGPGTTPPLLAARSQAVTGPWTANQSWSITGTSLDGTEHPVGNLTLRFLNKRYWGVSTNTTLTDAQVIALAGKELSTGRAQTRTLSPSAQYLYFAWPTSFGTPTFIVNGLTNTDWQLVTRSFVNASGAAVLFDIYRSTFLQNSPVTVQVQ